MSSMLDDMTYISETDPSDALGFAARQPGQLKHDFGLSQHDFSGEIKNVVFAGMGGSSLVAEFTHTYPQLKAPFVVCKEYHLPAFVSADTLVICASYSGNTEETLSTLTEAEAKGARIAVIAHGGKLKDIAAEKDYVFAEIPECPQPRTGVFYMYRAVCELLVAAKLTDAHILQELENVVAPLEAKTAGWNADVATDQNEAKQLALNMQNTTPIIYAGPLMAPAAYKWKIDANENAKNTAWSNVFPELNHNEFIGWTSHPTQKPFSVVDLVSSFEHPQILKRFEVSGRLLEGMKPASLRVEAQGETVLEHLLYVILLGDFATTYLALLNGVDPTPVKLVEQLKKEL